MIDLKNIKQWITETIALYYQLPVYNISCYEIKANTI
jgi:hypothetical protein